MVQKMLWKKSDQVNQLFRVPATDNLEGLKFQGVMGKMAALLEKTEGLVDKWLPALPKTGTVSCLENEYDDSYLLPRMFLLIMSVQTRLVHATKTKCESMIQAVKNKVEKTKCDVKGQITSIATTVVKKIKATFEPQVKQLKALIAPKVKQIQAKVEPKVKEVMKTKQYTQACAFASKGLTFCVVTCEKIIGKERTKSLIQAIEANIPESCKARKATPKTVPVTVPGSAKFQAAPKIVPAKKGM